MRFGVRIRLGHGCMQTELMFSSEGDLWRTETPLVQWLDRQFHFSLDAAASDDTIAPAFINAQQNALVTPWSGRVFCNPPYSMVEKFVNRAIHQIRSNEACEGVCLLVASRTDTQWFQTSFRYWQQVWFLQGRLKFWMTPDEAAAVNARRALTGKKPLGLQNTAPFPSVVLVRGFGMMGQQVRCVDWRADLKKLAV